MSSAFCSTCDKFMAYPESHKCLPAFEVFLPEYLGEEDGIKVNAYDAEEAAELAIERWDRDGDYTCIGGDEINVTVKASDGTVTKFVVTGESQPVYHASEVA